MGAKFFKAYDGSYLVAEEGHLYTQHHKDHKAQFHVEEHDGGKKVSLKTHNGHYVGVNSGQEIYVKHDHKSDEVKWHLENHHGKVALKSHHGGYLTINETGHAHVNPERNERSLFEEISA